MLICGSQYSFILLLCECTLQIFSGDQQKILSLSSEVATLKEQLKSKSDEVETLKAKLSDAEKAEQSASVAFARQSEKIVSLEETSKIQVEQLSKKIESLMSVRDSDSSERYDWQVKKEEVESTPIELGHGGWGKVTVGWFRGKKVALKQMHHLIIAPETTKMVKREINLMAKVRHPNLLLFIAAVIDDKQGHIIITELLETTLRDAYLAGKLANDKVRLSIMRDVAAGLNYLHLQQVPVIHRDISSANILLEASSNNSWKGKVCDFGSANFVEKATTCGPGAIVYSAPEVLQKLANNQTTKVDTYSYGILMCEVLSNQFPMQEKLQEMLRVVYNKWIFMHDLIQLCISTNSSKRPTMAYILNTLNKKFFP